MMNCVSVYCKVGLPIFKILREKVNTSKGLLGYFENA